MPAAVPRSILQGLAGLCLLLPAAVLTAAPPLRIELVSANTSIQPGVPFEVGLHLRHKKTYHTYWKHPGIVGVPTQIEWNLPQGWQTDPIQWPEPKQVHMFQIRAQGYHGEVLLPIRLTPPRQLPLGQSITLTGKASWMCCSRDCNPGHEILELTLPVSSTPTAPDPAWTQAFAASHRLIPRPLPKDWQTSVSRQESSILLTLTPLSDAAKTHAAAMETILFFTDDGLINPDQDQLLTRLPGGGFTLKLPISEYYEKPFPAKLTGVLQTPQLWSTDGPKSATIAVPIKH